MTPMPTWLHFRKMLRKRSETDLSPAFRGPATAQEKAVEALIAASLRAPDKEAEVTKEEISRHAEQRVTLSSEDKAALEKSKSGVMQAIKSILLDLRRGNWP